MSKDTTLRVMLYSVNRLNSSVNGNPRFNLQTSDGVYLTKSDSAINYDVENIANTIPVGGELEVTLHMTAALRVWDIEVLTAYQDDDQRLGGNDNPYED